MTEHQRAVAICDRCGSAYASRVRVSGEVRPIGTQDCSCGSDEFRVLE